MLYRIRVERAGPGNEVELELDGRTISGSVIPFPVGGKKEVHVVARLGRPQASTAA